jgi:hypothetical protein
MGFGLPGVLLRDLVYGGTETPRNWGLGLLVRDVFLPLVVFGSLASRTLYINIL